jgi:hypothetical protein
MTKPAPTVLVGGLCAILQSSPPRSSSCQSIPQTHVSEGIASLCLCILYCNSSQKSSPSKALLRTPAVELTGPANSCHTSSTPANWPCYHHPGGTTIWHACFTVFVIPTAVITALAIVEILVYGGDS